MTPRTWLIIALAGIVYLLGNGRIALWDRDEPRYALASRHMLNSGDWVVPRVGWGADPNRPRTAKPVGIYWTQAAAMTVAGDGSFGARLPSAVAMVLLLILAGVLVGRSSGKDVAFWTVLVLASSAMAIVAAKMCVTDAVLLLFITGAQAGVFALWCGRREWWIPVAVGFCIGAAGLVKGPVVLGVIATTLMVLAVLGWMARKMGLNRTEGRGFEPILNEPSPQPSPGVPGEGVKVPPVPSPAGPAQPDKVGRARVPADTSAGALTSPDHDGRSSPVLLLHVLIILLVTAAVVVPWLIMVEQRSPGFISTAWRHDVATRIAEPLEGHKGPPGYYLLSIWGTFFPWSFLLITALVIAWRNLADARVRFALAAVIGPWLMMESVQTKLVHYILPIFPPLAFLVGDMLARGLRGEFDDLRRRGAGVAGIIFAVIAIALTAALWMPGKWFPIPRAATLAMGLVGLAWGLAVMVLFMRRQPARAAVAMGVGMLVLCGVAAGWYLPQADYLRLSPRVAHILNAARARAPGRVVMLGRNKEGYKEQSLAFYAGPDVTEDPRDIPAARYAVTSPGLVPDGMSIVGDPVDGWNYANGQRLRLVVVFRP